MWCVCIHIYIFVVDTFDYIYMSTEIYIEALKKQTGIVSPGCSLYIKVIWMQRYKR